jgi:LPXTG-motif cell wall-anchored protein
MHLTRTAVGALVAGATVLTLAGPASATDADVSYRQACVPGANYWNATVTVASRWDGLSHINIGTPASTATMTVAAHDTNSLTFKVFVGSYHVIVSSPDAHLHGELDHTFTQPEGCTIATTTTVPPTTTTVPEVTTTAPTTTTVALSPTTTTRPTSPPPTVTVAPRPPTQLPATGSEAGVVIAVVGLAVFFAGAALVAVAIDRRRG